jgi:hypothetical protein
MSGNRAIEKRKLPDPTELVDSLGDLDAKEKHAVVRETQALVEAMVNFGRSRLAVGEHLYNIREILKPNRTFMKYLATFNTFSPRTADRMINGYLNAQGHAPEQILLAAMSRGMDLIGSAEDRPLGRYTEAAKVLPPPRTTDPVKINNYLDRLQEKKREFYVREENTLSLNEALQECFRFLDSRIQRLPNNHKTRASFCEKIVGMIMTDLGVSQPRQFSPVAFESSWKAKRPGRPPKIKEEDAA